MFFNPTNPAFIIFAGSLLVLLVLLLILLHQPSVLVLSTNERGRLAISRHALHRIVEACCEQIKGVATARAFVVRSRGRFYTEVRLKIRPDAKLDAIQGYLTQEIANIYRQNLGLKEVGPIEVKIVGVIGENAGF
ncbi:MAG TPA: hypothetical protein VNW23_01485 [Opitutaceae bacterium]|jgi:hypothetical protein|nr:hypothetical protein [Opitutaceae bacterium]